jgi:hypothetical protein
MKAFFLGAGASAGTLPSSDTFAGVPVAAQFGEILSKIEPEWTKKYPALVRIINHLHPSEKDWGLDPVWTCMDYYAKLQEAIDADALVVVGYSFPTSCPQEDQYGRFLIQEGVRLRRRDQKNKLTIEFFELKDKAGEREQAIMDAFEGRVAKPIYRGEVEPTT